MKNHLHTIMEDWKLSGTALMKKGEDIPFIASLGFANRAERIPNEHHTRFGIASGCKLFTAIAICQLVEAGKLSFDTPLSDWLDAPFPNVTIHHLLTHTSGVPDYFDEEITDDFEDLWKDVPMYHLRRLKDFLPLFQHAPMKFPPGHRFHYNNAGFILLGLVVESVSGVTFQEYVEANVFQRAGMHESGYFAFDTLPAKTALGYIDLEDGSWKTNLYSLPVIGGSDGGAYVTAEDMMKLWLALMRHELLNETYTQKLLTPHVHCEDDDYYGYGVWIKQQDGAISKYHVMGYDPGVCFHSAFYPTSNGIVVVCANQSSGAYDVMAAIEALFSEA
ncbi:serine hydrolase [Halalkalibacterium halodurans]|uniref:Penicillin-binding protein n=1 Tax=Halalkalibacterium halodurans (strain ATCC BAA-125 / DSM 18197 / FERM 7344 / JCM 9153 / C-125) TaxID=272558 RepID=Q9KAM0_HALH5|nr:serine hydrolase [Halalkalibacterium halodurans]MDY7222818.1 serine hydrolase [Halalkalibacterium halodurans]MDY7242039.1 serine hydrolase [Halalkalibacterium halodurans]MED4080950.1 serine hydrolase [Halalkalibacterium halodurans]MED4085133.1 serine hydrolase [Halalkalibacterium halodurans]MED4105289.1 serine hydrolase [Halalkalibacterium halodurans]